MNLLKSALYTASLLSVSLLAAKPSDAQFATGVVSYAPGATPASGFINASAALGSPERFTGEDVFPGVVSPFSPPFLNTEIVSVGEGGQITLRLSNYVLPQAAGPEIGVFENVGVGFGAGGVASGSFGIDPANVEVSGNGSTWVSLGNITFDIPSNGYTDLTDPFSGVAGSSLADFQKPFTGVFADFSGKAYAGNPGNDILSLLNGSGGGKWLDISGTGLSQVGFIRFSVPNDGTAVNQNFELDAVAIAHAAVGGTVVPEPGVIPILLGAIGAVIAMHRRPHRRRGRA